MNNYNEESKRILDVINDYFTGIFNGDIETLRSSFHTEVVLYGDVKGVEYLKSLDDYLEGVKNRQSPMELGEENRMKVLSIEVLGQVAMAKVNVPMYGFNYYDFLSFAIIEGDWKIVNKVFTHVE